MQNLFFVEHLPVAAYVRFLKEKEWRKWNSVFIVLSLTFFFVALQGSVGEIRTFQPQKWKKIKNSQPQTKFTGYYKKKSVFEQMLIDFPVVEDFFGFTEIDMT